MNTTAKRLPLQGSLTLQTIEAVHAELVALLEHHDAIELDCAGLAETDLSLVQLIIAAQKSARRLGKSVTLAGPASGALAKVLSRAGFLGTGLPQAAGQEAFWLSSGGAA
jgi:ABC-type transporter Mla MlaB component